MSITACRSCQQQITFVLSANGRWRPVEVVFEELVLAGQEIATEMISGNWTETDVDTVRIYTVHICPENPAWNRGRPRMRLGNDATGEVMDEPEPLPDKETPTYTGRELREMREVAQWLEQHPIDAKYPCAKCRAEVGAPCRNAYFGVAGQVHRERHIATFFDEDDETQSWPPTRENQRGLKIMRNWLSQNASVLTGEEE